LIRKWTADELRLRSMSCLRDLTSSHVHATCTQCSPRAISYSMKSHYVPRSFCLTTTEMCLLSKQVSVKINRTSFPAIL
jgi:hypothetical protein